MIGARRKLVRTAIAMTIVLPLVVVRATLSFATHPTKADVATAKAKLEVLNHQLEVVGEQYNAARIALAGSQAKLAAAKLAMSRAETRAAAARNQLSVRAVQAYTGMGSQYDAILGAQDFSQFSDRLEFMGAVAQSDADLATKADLARQQASWAAQTYAGAVSTSQTRLATVDAQRSNLTSLLGQAQSLYQQTSANYQSFLAAQRAAIAAQAAQDAAGNSGGATISGTTGGSGETPGGGSYNPPPPDVGGAARAIDAAKQVIGTQYVFGAADPSIGFDCSGLTMWAWGQSGVSLPHNAAAQYAVLPHVAMDQIQPGDLLFFYWPTPPAISHVAMYLGGGMMIHTTNPGPGGGVRIEALGSIWTPLLEGAARP
jgi:cell wall-associated NlpC family hydrolase